MTLEQRLYGSARGEARCRLSLVEQFHLRGIAVEQFLHGGRHGGGIEAALVAIGQHSGHAVVAGNDHIATAGLAGVKHIVGRQAGGRGTARSTSGEFYTGGLLHLSGQKLAGKSLGASHVDGRRSGHIQGCHHGEHGGDSSFGYHIVI